LSYLFLSSLGGFFIGHSLEIKKAVEEGGIFPDKLAEWYLNIQILFHSDIRHFNANLLFNRSRQKAHGETFKFFHLGSPALFTSNKEAIKV
jgi:hypothetical protein